MRKQKAAAENKWFLPEFISTAENNIVTEFLRKSETKKLEGKPTQLANQNRYPVKHVGIMMAGNMPLVGFHDFLMYLLPGTGKLSNSSRKR